MENQYPPAPQEETIDIRKYINLIISNWYWFVLCMIIGVTSAFLLNRYSQTSYSVSSTLIVRDDDNARGVTGAEGFIQGLKLLQQTKSVQNEIGILQTYTLARLSINNLPEFAYTYVKVGRTGIKEDQMYTQCPFTVEQDTLAPIPYGTPIHVILDSPTSFYLQKNEEGDNKKTAYPIGQWINVGESRFCIKWRTDESFKESMKGFHYFFTYNDPHVMANMYRGKLAVALNDKKGSILTLTIRGAVAKQEADYLNKLMEMYIQYGLQSKNSIAENTMRFIDSQLGGISDSLRKSEFALQNYRSRNMIIDISKEGSALYEQLKGLQVEKNLADIRTKYLEYLRNYIEQKKDIKDLIMPSVIGITDQTLNKVIMELNDLYVQKQVMGYNIQPNSPGMDVMNLKMENTRKVLLQNVKSLIETNNLAVKDVKDRLKEVDAEVAKLPSSERELVSIKRDFDVLDKMYTYLLEKRAEAGIAKASNISDSRILDEAMDRNAAIVSPKTKMNYMIGLFLGFLIPFSILLAISFLNNTIQDRKELEANLKVPIYGGLGHNFKGSDIPVYENPKSSLAESFRSLRTNLQYAGLGKEAKVVMITSTMSGEGKTFIALNLAAIFAVANKKTLLIGLDMRKPKLNKIFNVTGQEGISTYLSGQSEYNSIIKQSAIQNLYLVPSGPVPPNPAELLETGNLQDFIAKASKEFDYIIIDTPPIAVVTDAYLVSPVADICLFVVRQNYSSKDVIKLLDSLYTRKDIKHLGIVLNDVQVNTPYGNTYKYGYGYGYGYSSPYGKGYYSDEEVPDQPFLLKIRKRLGLRSKV